MTSSHSVHGDGRLSAVENGEIQSKSHHADAASAPQSWADIVRSKFLGSDPRSCAGVCMLAFAIPLLIPGITLTVVVFQDEKGFSKFSALHVIGMILLAVAILLIVAGLILSIHCSSKVSPDDGPQNVSTHERSPQNYTISQRFDSHGSYMPHRHTGENTPEKIPLPASYVISQGKSAATDDIGSSAGKFDVGSRPPASIINNDPTIPAEVPQDGLPEGQGCSEDVAECYSSSSGSLDSDVSSASYSIHESADEVETGTPFDVRTKFNSPRSGQKMFDWDLAASVPGSRNAPRPFPLVNPSNFDLKSKNFFDWCSNEKDSQPGNVSGDARESQHINNEASVDAADDAEGPTLRQRLYAVSGDLSRPSSDGVARPPLRHSGHSEDQNSSMSESNSSVFPADSTTVLTKEISFEPALPTSDGLAPNGERRSEFNTADLPSRQSGILNVPKRPQSDGLVRQVHFSVRTGTKSWPENSFSKTKDSALANVSGAHVHLTETPAKNSIALNDSPSDSHVTKLSNEKEGGKPALNALYSNVVDTVADVSNDAVCVPASSDNEQDLRATIRAGNYIMTESDGVVSHDKSTNSDLYTSSLGVFSS